MIRLRGLKSVYWFINGVRPGQFRCAFWFSVNNTSNTRYLNVQLQRKYRAVLLAFDCFFCGASVICCEKLANVKYSAKQAKKTSLQRQFCPTSKEHQL